MDKWKAMQVGGVTVLVFAIGAQVWKQPGDDEAHIHRESHNGPDQQQGRVATLYATSSSTSVSSARPRWIVSM